MKTVKIVGMTHQFGGLTHTNPEVEGKYTLEPGIVFQKTGIKMRYKWASYECPPEYIAIERAKTLLGKLGIPIEKVSAVFGSSNPYGKQLMPASTFRVAQGLRFKRDPYVLHGNYGCGGYFATLDAMWRWLQSEPAGSIAVMVLVDHPSSMVNRYTTEALFSDAVHVSVWSNDENLPGLVVEQPWMAMAKGDMNALSIEDGYWEMDGSAISKFVKRVPKLIADRMLIDLSEYDIVPHQPNVRLLETLEGEYGVPFYKEVVRERGNPTCSGTMIALEHFLQNNQSTKPILAMGFGDSLSYGAMIVHR